LHSERKMGYTNILYYKLIFIDIKITMTLPLNSVNDKALRKNSENPDI
jgi:hypothetical protein